MRPSLSLKTLLRAPFKTLLTFLLIAAASFGLFYRVADYAVTRRETARAVSWYRGVAALDNGVPNMAQVLFSQLPNTRRYSFYRDTHPWPSPLTAEQMYAFSSLPGVSLTDTRYLTAGVIDDLERIAYHGPYIIRWNYTARFVIEGTYTGYRSLEWGRTKSNILHLTDCRPLAGDIPMARGDDTSIISFAEGGEHNGIWNMRAFYRLGDNPFGQSFVDGLTVGERYLFIGRWNPDPTYSDTYASEDNALALSPLDLFIGDQDTLDYCDSFWRLNGKPENYLETEEFARVREIVDITNRDLKTFDMVYTSDMLAIPRFNKREMVIQEGRALTQTDTNACVVNLELLKLNGLKVGDKLTVELCDKLLPQHAEMGALAVIHERYGMPVKTVELEIVGAYTDTDPQYARDAANWWCYSPNTIFVPSSLLPVEVPIGYEVRPAEFSVVIDDATMIEPFLDAARPLAKDMGITLQFSDKGWMKVKDSVNTNQTMSLITTVLYAAAAAVALLLAAYLYIGRQKKTYAIMRALGTPRDKARNALALPLAVLSALAVPTGGIAGMIYAAKAIATALENLAAAIEQYVPDTSLPVGTMLACLLCEAAFLVLLSALFMRKLAKTPPLALLQGDTVRVKVKKTAGQATQGQTAPPPEFALSFPIGSDLPKRGGYGAANHVSRYILRHMRRAGGKTAIALLLAVLLTGAVGLLAVTRLSYREMFDQTVVTGTLSNYPSSSVMEAQRSEHMEDFYYSGKSAVIVDGETAAVGYLFALTNDIERYFQSRYDYGYSIEYAEGYDSSFFSKNEPLCLVGNWIAKYYGVKPGDTIRLLSFERHIVLSGMYENETYEELCSRLQEVSKEFKVAGVITPEDGLSEFDRRNIIGNMAVSIYAPLSVAAEEISPYGEYPFPVEYGEFKLVDKENPYVLRDYLNEMASVDHKYMEVVTSDLDTTELDNIKRIRDMLNLLFPIAAAAAILIGLTAPGLIIMQSAKEAAILRILGTTKPRARCMLAVEQISLCVFGLAIATLGLMTYNPGLFARSSGTLILCGGLYLVGCASAAVFAAASVTRRKVLELLQVKE